MKTAIYYLSATGNSLSVAKKIASAIEDTELHSIPDELAAEHFSTDAETVGLVFPLHYFGMPMLVEDYLRRLDLTSARYVFAVVTCGMPCLGSCFHDLSALLGAKGKSLNASWYIRMISTYIKMRDIPSAATVEKALAAADKKTDNIINTVIHHGHAATSEFFAWPLRSVHKKWRKKRETLADCFTADTAQCTGCGTCEKICPAGNIMLVDDKPRWRKNCTECLACLHACPQKAINAGEKTKTCRRYRHPDVTTAELLRK